MQCDHALTFDIAHCDLIIPAAYNMHQNLDTEQFNPFVFVKSLSVCVLQYAVHATCTKSTYGESLRLLAQEMYHKLDGGVRENKNKIEGQKHWKFVVY